MDAGKARQCPHSGESQTPPLEERRDIDGEPPYPCLKPNTEENCQVQHAEVIAAKKIDHL